MANIPVYCARKLGKDEHNEHWYPHPKLEPVLRETYGVIIYQEQVMQIAQILSGYSLGEADLLRRAMGKKIKAEMDAQRERFVSGAVERGVDTAQGRRDLRPPREVRRLRLQQEPRRRLCARRLPDRLSEGQPSGRVPGRVDDARSSPTPTSSSEFRREAQRLGIKVEPPSVNRSGVVFDVVDAEGRLDPAMRWRPSRASAGRRSRRCVEARGDEPFRDLADFARRINPRAVNKRTLESLIAAGALDELEPDRARAAAAVDAVHGARPALA